MWSAERRYDISFTEITGKVPVFHPDVRVFEVRESQAGRRPSRPVLPRQLRAGRQAVRARGPPATGRSTSSTARLDGDHVEQQQLRQGRAGRAGPDFARRRAGRCSTSSATRCTRCSRTSPTPGSRRTPRDFVEYPSQVNEQWLLTREVLDRFARHYQTGEPMPQALVDKIEQSEKFNQGYATVEYLAAAIVDMELHTRPDGVVDPAAFERDALARIGMPREIALRHRLPQFDHLFASDAYSAGYYSYLWSEVMAADTWQAFVEGGGPWDKARRRSVAQAHPRGRQLDRSREGLPPVPRPRSGRSSAARGAGTVGRR